MTGDTGQAAKEGCRFEDSRLGFEKKSFGPYFVKGGHLLKWERIRL